MGRVTRLGGLLGLLGRVTLSAGLTICHAIFATSQSGVTRFDRVAFMLQKDQMSQTITKHECVKTFYIF